MSPYFFIGKASCIDIYLKSSPRNFMIYFRNRRDAPPGECISIVKNLQDSISRFFVNSL